MLCTAAVASLAFGVYAATPVFRHRFDSAKDDSGRYIGEAVEGAGVFPLINSDKWILMYDCYMNGHYQFCETEDLDNFTLRAETATSGAFTPRHGTVIPLTPEKTERLLQKFPAAAKAANSSGNLCAAQRTRATT